MSKIKKKVIVAMSGGVDSSVTAFLLKQKDYDVAGVFMKFWTANGDTNSQIHTDDINNYNENTCCGEESEAAARAVADKLNMPFYVIDCQKEFKKAVVDYFLAEYQAGRTPNPCVVCNREIKFGLMLKKMQEMGGDYLSTGHYVRLKQLPLTPILSPQAGRGSNKRVFQILKAKDDKKDQTYFLWTLTQEKLKHLLFPIGDYTKDEVRKIAKENNLPYFKKESFDVCFVNGEVGDFLKNHLKLEVGDIVLPDGQVIGKHEGLPLYTIGQRQGMRIGYKKPLYVAGYNPDKNQLIVVDDIKHPMLLKKELIISRLSWIGADFNMNPSPQPLPTAGRLSLKKGEGVKIRKKDILIAKIRYGAKEAIVDKLEKLDNNEYKVIFKEPVWAATPGQSIVFYSSENELLGGGIII